VRSTRLPYRLQRPLTSISRAWPGDVGLGAGPHRTPNLSHRRCGCDRRAKSAPAQIATLILPAEPPGTRPTASPRSRRKPARELFLRSHRQRREGAARRRRQALLLLTGGALTEQGLALAAQIAGKTGCKVMGQTYNPRMARGKAALRSTDSLLIEQRCRS